MSNSAKSSHSYNAHHAPIGAFASLTLGFPGASGGLGLELGGPANQNFYVGVEDDNRIFRLLPFFEGAAGSEESLRYASEGQATRIPTPVCMSAWTKIARPKLQLRCALWQKIRLRAR